MNSGFINSLNGLDWGDGYQSLYYDIMETDLGTNMTRVEIKEKELLLKMFILIIQWTKTTIVTT